MDIRKADSKGRLSGFEAGISYWVDQGNGVIRLERVVRQYDLQTPLNPRAYEYLARFFDPSAVSVNGHDAEGFWLLELDSDGNRMYTTSRGGDLVKTWTPWPEGFDYEEFKRLSWL